MAEIEGHYASCEKAESHSCACGVCGGAWHGWTDAVRLARHPEPQRRQDLRRTADSRWDSAFKKCKTPGRSTFPKKAASMDSVVADIVDLLADNDRRSREGKWRPNQDELNTAPPDEHGLPLPRHAGETSGADFDDDEGGHDQERRTKVQHPGNEPATSENPEEPSELIRGPRGKSSVDELRQTMESGSTVDQVEALGTAVLGRALDDISKRHDGKVPNEANKAFADHFWCDFLANAAKYLAKLRKIASLMPDRLAKWISERVIESRHEQERLPLGEEDIRIATKSACKILLYLTEIVDLRSTLLAVRILGVLTCKSPERHRAVAEHCVDPICKHLTVEVKRRLATVIEQEWIPTIQENAVQSTR